MQPRRHLTHAQIHICTQPLPKRNMQPLMPTHPHKSKHMHAHPTDDNYATTLSPHPCTHTHTHAHTTDDNYATTFAYTPAQK